MRGDRRRMILAITLAGAMLAPVELPFLMPTEEIAAQAPRSKKKKTSAGGSASKGKTSAKSSKKGATKGKGASKGGSRRKGKGTSAPSSSAEATKRKEAADREITLTKEQIRENDRKIKAGLTELNRLQSGIDASTRQVGLLSGKVKSLDGKISGLRGEVARGEKEVAKMRAEYLKAVKKMRAKRSNRSAIAFIFSSENFNQALRRMRYLRQFSAWKDKKSSEITARVSKLRAQQKELQDARTLQSQLLAKEENARQTLAGQRQKQDMVVVELRRNGDALNAHLSKKQAEANALKGQIASLIAAEERKRQAAEEQKRVEEQKRRQKEEALAAEERRRQEQEAREARARAEEEARQIEAEKKMNEQERKKAEKERKERAKKEAREREEKARKEKQLREKQRKEQEKRAREEAKKKNSKPASVAKPAPAPSKQVQKPAPSGNFAASRGSLPRPVDGSFRVTSQFGRHALPELPDVMYDNPGIDAEVASGASAKAVFPGRVSGVYVIPGFSTVVIVNHGDYYTVYGNIQAPSVKVGDTVRQGQSLGRLAKDPDDPSHSSIHFEVWKNRDKLNPMDWIR